MKTLIKLIVLIMIIGFIGTNNNPTVSNIRNFIYTTYGKICKEINKVDIEIKNDNNINSVDETVLIIDTIVYVNNGEITNNNSNEIVERNLDRTQPPVEIAERTLGYIESNNKKRN